MSNVSDDVRRRLLGVDHKGSGHKGSGPKVTSHKGSGHEVSGHKGSGPKRKKRDIGGAVETRYAAPSQRQGGQRLGFNEGGKCQDTKASRRMGGELRSAHAWGDSVIGGMQNLANYVGNNAPSLAKKVNGALDSVRPYANMAGAVQNGLSQLPQMSNLGQYASKAAHDGWEAIQNAWNGSQPVSDPTDQQMRQQQANGGPLVMQRPMSRAGMPGTVGTGTVSPYTINGPMRGYKNGGAMVCDITVVGKKKRKSRKGELMGDLIHQAMETMETLPLDLSSKRRRRASGGRAETTWGNTLRDALTGAATGGVTGSVIPGLGTTVGAITGGVGALGNSAMNYLGDVTGWWKEGGDVSQPGLDDSSCEMRDVSQSIHSPRMKRAMGGSGKKRLDQY